MALHQRDIFCGRRPADYLTRSAELIRCSVAPLSCTRRLRVDGECRVLLTASGPRFVCVRDTLDPWRLTAGPRRPRACRGPQRQQTPCCRVRPGERGVPRRSGGCALGSRGQRIAGVARRPVVVVSISSGRRAGHVPSPVEVRGRGLASRFRGLQDAPSACCPSLRTAQTWTRSNSFEANGSGSSSVTRCSSTTVCVARHCLGST